jgi:hypothetical protein
LERGQDEVVTGEHNSPSAAAAAAVGRVTHGTRSCSSCSNGPCTGNVETY